MRPPTVDSGHLTEAHATVAEHCRPTLAAVDLPDQTPAETFVADLLRSAAAEGPYEAGPDAYCFPAWSFAPATTLHLAVDGEASVWINGIESSQRREGHATTALGTLVRFARIHDVVLRGSPDPYGDPGPGRRALLAWYGRLGFDLEQERDPDAGLADIIRFEPIQKDRP